MNLKSSNNKMNVINFDWMTKSESRTRHGDLFPNMVRSIICGTSNCGKTNLMLTLLIHPKGLKYQNVYVYSKSLNQPKYVLLKQILDGVKEVNYFTYSNSDQIISPTEAKQNSVIIFDDVILDKQNNIKEYFARGRHYNCDTFFLAQTYSAISKQLLRDNTNLFILFKMDELNLHHVYNDVVNTDMTYEKFRDLCAQCWNTESRFGFIIIDKEADLNKGRYRKGFDTFFTI